MDAGGWTCCGLGGMAMRQIRPQAYELQHLDRNTIACCMICMIHSTWPAWPAGRHRGRIDKYPRYVNELCYRAVLPYGCKLMGAWGALGAWVQAMGPWPCPIQVRNRPDRGYLQRCNGLLSVPTPPPPLLLPPYLTPPPLISDIATGITQYKPTF